MEAPEEVILDANELAKGHEYFELGYVEHSPDEKLLAYAADYTGSEQHELRFRDLATGTDLDDVLHGVYYGAAWAADNRTFFYTRTDATVRPHQVWRHRLRTPPGQDVPVLQEDAGPFELTPQPPKTHRFIFLPTPSQAP